MLYYIKYKRLDTIYIAINYKVNRLFRILIIINTIPALIIRRQLFEESADEEPADEEPADKKSYIIWLRLALTKSRGKIIFNRFFKVYLFENNYRTLLKKYILNPIYNSVYNLLYKIYLVLSKIINWLYYLFNNYKFQ